MKSTKVIDFLKKYGIITLGCVLFSLGVALFLDANDIPTGGATGIAIIIRFISQRFSADWDTGIISLAINIPLLIFGGIVFGKKFVVSTCYATAVSSLLITLWRALFKDFLPITNDLLISSVTGAALFGLGVGLIFKVGSSTGGTDVIVKYLGKRFRFLKMGSITVALDFIIITSSALIMWNGEKLFYAILTSVVFSLVFDLVLYGGNSAKLVYIITEPEKADELKNRVLHELDAGATFMDAKGAYSGKDKKVLFCAVRNTLFPKLKDVVKEVDDRAFMVITSAQEIYGEGYQKHDNDDI